MKTKRKSTKPKMDYEAFTKAAYPRLVFALEKLIPNDGSREACLVNRKTGKVRPWQDYFIEVIEMIPGITIDREAVYACQLPRKERLKWFKKNRPTEPTPDGP